MTKKVLQLIGCCNDCPRKSYYSGGRSECSETRTLLPFNEGHSIPGWCPLTNYPSALMEKQREQIIELEKQIAERDKVIVAMMSAKLDVEEKQ